MELSGIEMAANNISIISQTLYGWEKEFAAHADFAQFRSGRRTKASRAVSSKTASLEILKNGCSDVKEPLKIRLKCVLGLQSNDLPPG
ncbi:hypothetical protein [Chlorobium sp.]|nr:hypothetical protein [Chlorobium sp.]